MTWDLLPLVFSLREIRQSMKNTRAKPAKSAAVKALPKTNTPTAAAAMDMTMIMAATANMVTAASKNTPLCAPAAYSGVFGA